MRRKQVGLGRGLMERLERKMPPRTQNYKMLNVPKAIVKTLRTFVKKVQLIKSSLSIFSSKMSSGERY